MHSDKLIEGVNMTTWKSENGRITQIQDLNEVHLINIVLKLERLYLEISPKAVANTTITIAITDEVDSVFDFREYEYCEYCETDNGTESAIYRVVPEYRPLMNEIKRRGLEENLNIIRESRRAYQKYECSKL